MYNRLHEDKHIVLVIFSTLEQNTYHPQLEWSSLFWLTVSIQAWLAAALKGHGGNTCYKKAIQLTEIGGRPWRVELGRHMFQTMPLMSTQPGPASYSTCRY